MAEDNPAVFTSPNMKGNVEAVELGPVGPANPLHTKYKADLPKCIASCLPVVTKGCCCCTLRTCCLVQGWLALVVNIITLVRTVVTVSQPKLTVTVCDPTVNHTLNRCHDADVDNPMQFGSNPWVSSIYALLLIYAVASIAISILFIDGIGKRKPSRMVHFIRLNSVDLFLDITTIIVLSVIETRTTTEVTSFIRCGLSVYSFICAHSFYVKMVQELEEQDAGAAHPHPGHPGQPALPSPPTKYDVVPAVGLTADPPPAYPTTMGSF